MSNKKICYSDYPQNTVFPIPLGCKVPCTDTATAGDYYQADMSYIPYILIGVFMLFLILLIITRPGRVFFGRRPGFRRRPFFRPRFGPRRGGWFR